MRRRLQVLLTTCVLSLLLPLGTIPAVTGQQSAFDATHWIEIVLVDRDDPSEVVEGACFVIWSMEGLILPLYACDNATAASLVPISLGEAEGGQGTPQPIDDESPEPGVLWLDVRTLGQTVLVEEVSSPTGYGPTGGCLRHFRPCAGGQAEVGIGEAVGFFYEGEGTTDVPATRPTEPSFVDAVVELYPGYPGYRGVVPGLVGKGDTAYLSELLAWDPTFSREREDEANREVARQLGIAGDIPDWTWEIWMAIGAERGYGHICYACMWTGQELVTPVGPPMANAADFDPRRELTRFDSDLFVRTVALEEGWFNIPERFFDAELRIVASLGYGGYPTASELLASARTYLVRSSGFPDAGAYWSRAICNHGHAPVPRLANENEEILLLYVSAVVIGNYMMATNQATSLLSAFDMIFQRWQQEVVEDSFSARRFGDALAERAGLTC
jgi:hypothetical protein